MLFEDTSTMVWLVSSAGSVIAATTIAALITFFIQTKKAGVVEHQLQQAHADREQAISEKQLAQSDYGHLQGEHHRLQVDQSALQARIESYAERQAELESRLHAAEQNGRATTEAMHTAQSALEAAQTDLKGKAERIAQLNERLEQTTSDLKGERNTIQGKLDELQQRYNGLSADHVELKTSLDERESHHQQQLAQFGEHKKALTEEFENLANKIFEEKGKTFTHTSKESIDVLLKPFREQIDGFQRRINEVHGESIRGNSNLNAEIKKVLDIGLKMSDDATSLTRALKGDSQQRGAWGEAQLRRTLEMSGLVENAHYETQSAFKDGEGKQKHTDYLIKLPDDKHMIIDSKVSLVAYDKALAAETPEEYNLAMAEHVKAVKKHIDDLSAKDYTNLVGVTSPTFVLMFMPIEPAYIEALKSSKDLFGYGYEKNIVLVSHTTLIPILRTVSNLWALDRSNKEAREISEKAGEIYNQVALVAERLQKLGGTLNTASKHYNDTVKGLVGQQGLYGKVLRFDKLSAKASKTLPTLEPVHADFEAERLALVAEPVAEVDTLVPDLETPQS